MDWEVELVVVIGKEVMKGASINESNYQEYIFGYTIGLDVSARDWQAKDRNGGQILIAKSMDGFLPLGILIKNTKRYSKNAQFFNFCISKFFSLFIFYPI